jgi:hypothetical protein
LLRFTNALATAGEKTKQTAKTVGKKTKETGRDCSQENKGNGRWHGRKSSREFSNDESQVQQWLQQNKGSNHGRTGD